MIKVEVIKDFTLKDIDKIHNLKRAGSGNKDNKLYEKDTFECDKEMVDYLMGNNEKNATVIKLKEVEPKKNKK